MKQFLKSLFLYLIFIVLVLALLPAFWIACYIMREKETSRTLARLWTKITLKLVEKVVGLHSKTEGFEKIKKHPTPLIIASKHQSMWETGVLVDAFGEESVFVIKKELRRIPLFGTMITLMGAIAIDRKKPVQALRQLINEAKETVENRAENIIIFPEGGRKAVGETADYADGVYLLYKTLKIPVAAIAVNSGVFWPKHSFVKHAGVAKACVVDIIYPGLDRDAFRERLSNSIESGSLALVQSHQSEQHNVSQQI